MKIMAFASRNMKEMVRDKLNLIFGIGFPVILLLLLSAIQSNVPVNLFAIEKLSPGIAVFGLSFISLFSGQLIAKDRSTSFMLRLLTSPMKSSDYILGYTIPLLPLSIAQVIICFVVSFFMGLPVKGTVVASIAVLIPSMILFIGIGLLCGAVFNDKQVGGVCGAILTNLTAWLSGTWFDLDLVGGGFKAVAEVLPFVHAVDAGRSALAGDWENLWPDLWWVIAYAAAIMIIAILAFSKKMNSDKI